MLIRKIPLLTIFATLVACPLIAANLEVNLYGSSTQFKFWKKVAPIFLQNQGCVLGDSVNVKNIDQAESRDGVFPLSHYITTCNNGADQLTIRLTGHKSSEGINAVQG